MPRRRSDRLGLAPTPAAESTPLAQRSDPTFFNTVLRSDQQQGNGATSYPAELHDGPFDMLGFIGEITSELQQKHSDLTNGVSEFNGLEPQLLMGMNGADAFALGPERPVDFNSTIAMGDITSTTPNEGSQSESPTSSVWSETRAMYEEQLLVYFMGSEPPPTIFGPVNMEWTHVKPAILAQSRDFRPLLNAIYCFSDIRKSMLDGKRWKLAPTYHRLASEEIQSCILGEVPESKLKRLFTAVFLLMVSEVCSALSCIWLKANNQSSCCALRSYVGMVHPFYTRPIFYSKGFMIGPKLGPDLRI